VRVPAKVNLHLRVGPRRDDGYHELETVFHAVSLFDDLTASLPHTAQEAAGLALTIEGEGAGELLTGEQNLAIRAARALAEYTGVDAAARLHLRKGIPVAGGMAGGSADAAGALLACRALWGVDVPDAELRDLAASLGSDVAFALGAGTALGRGRGERLEPVTVVGELHWVVAVADGGLSTPQVFERLDEIRAGADVPPPEIGAEILAAVRSGDAGAVAPLLRNDLQAAALDLRPSLRATLDAGLAAGALGGIVSGSGPTCVFLGRDRTHAADLADRMEASRMCSAAYAVAGPASVEW
jgi:4-diphosphocytidyl-2-C-methyl-D-erythritol kinase